MYMLVLRSILWWCFLIEVGIFQCHDKCIIYWQFMNQTAQFMNIARQHLMSSIVDLTTSWTIACQVCLSCHINLTQVSIFSNKICCHGAHHWHDSENSLLSRLCTQIEPTSHTSGRRDFTLGCPGVSWVALPGIGCMSEFEILYEVRESYFWII